MYLYETHCHTKNSSACASNTPEQIVELYLANGYNGVFITDHFLNGNAVVSRDDRFKNASYQEKIEAFCEGFNRVKEAAKNRLQVFLVIEYSYKGTDILVYGWNENQLKELENIMSMSMREFCVFCRESGVLAVQAHPFREDSYIDHIRLFPDAEGVETFNSSRNNLCNKMGELYAKEYGKISVGGSDCHHVNQKLLSGMAFEEKICSEQDFIDALRRGLGTIIKKENIFLK